MSRTEQGELIATRRALHRLTTAVWNAVLAGQINARSEAGDAALDAHDMLQQLPAKEREALEAFTELCRRGSVRQRPLEEFQTTVPQAKL